ncbi:putative protein tyrosine phosphatase type IVA A [Porphyridium purpureum]|uniref:Tyrosine specific protein phosphatases domain-containing protein n=1 Tax=Porphyridium purpureum TaxID=35688 RepID=A0A5J4Z2J5_PORPP|nr:putative protein tyrosine phosphatase type IVA A [Porphyridium purpureum]|eukprot:POR5806..scf295_1
MAHASFLMLARSTSEREAVRGRRDQRIRRSEPEQAIKPRALHSARDGDLHQGEMPSSDARTPSGVVAAKALGAAEKGMGGKSLSFATLEPQLPLQQQQNLFDAARGTNSPLTISALRPMDTVRRGVLPPRFTLVEHGSLRFMLSDAPRPEELKSFMATWRKSGVKRVVLACRPQYDASRLSPAFEVKDLDYEDGSVPSDAILSEWFALVDEMERANREYGSEEVIAVHCKTGLGRAPLLVALALVEYGMSPLEAVGVIRSLRRGAINVKQFQFLDEYVRRADRAGANKASPSLMQRAKNVLSKSASQNGGNGKRK